MAKSIVERIRAYALEHYNENGWDFVVECWESEDIQKHVLYGESELSYTVALARISNIVSAQHSRRLDIEGGF